MTLMQPILRILLLGICLTRFQVSDVFAGILNSPKTSRWLRTHGFKDAGNGSWLYQSSAGPVSLRALTKNEFRARGLAGSDGFFRLDSGAGEGASNAFHEMAILEASWLSRWMGVAQRKSLSSLKHEYSHMRLGTRFAARHGLTSSWNIPRILNEGLAQSRGASGKFLTHQFKEQFRSFRRIWRKGSNQFAKEDYDSLLAIMRPQDNPEMILTNSALDLGRRLDQSAQPILNHLNEFNYFESSSMTSGRISNLQAMETDFRNAIGFLIDYSPRRRRLLP